MKSDESEIEAHLAALEVFASGHSGLEELERAMAEFDALGFLGLSSSEEMHSNVLGWLLDPVQNHSLGNLFLKRFLLEVGAASCQDVIAGEWSNTLVKREWRNVVDGETGYLDILVVNHDARFVCAIENKIFSGEHSGQLTRYRKALEQHYPGYRRSHLLLSPRGAAPASAADRESWTPVSYSTILRTGRGCPRTDLETGSGSCGVIPSPVCDMPQEDRRAQR